MKKNHFNCFRKSVSGLFRVSTGFYSRTFFSPNLNRPLRTLDRVPRLTYETIATDVCNSSYLQCFFFDLLFICRPYSISSVQLHGPDAHRTPEGFQPGDVHPEPLLSAHEIRRLGRNRRSRFEGIFSNGNRRRRLVPEHG